jgi:hypothetical protein
LAAVEKAGSVGGFMSMEASGQEAPWRSGVRSARANVLPGFVLQVAALALVFAYYSHGPTREALARIAEIREDHGVGLAIVSTGFFGGFLPALYLRLRAATRNHYTTAQAAVITAFWAYKGFEVDLLYRLLARYVGEGHDFATIAIKTVFDQFIYCPIVAVPVTVLIYEWVAAQFRGDVVWADLRRGRWLRRRVLPVLISNLGVWLPMVCIIYSLPTPLQLPLQNLVLCFFTLIVAHQMRRAD